MFNSDKSHIFINEGKVASESGAVVLYRLEDKEDPSLAVRKFIGACLMTLMLVVLTIQAGWVYNAHAEGNPVTSPATSEESASPSPSESGSPVTYPEQSASPSASASASPSASPSGNPITAPEESPSAAPSASPSGNPITSPEESPSASSSAQLVITYPEGGEIFFNGQIINVLWEAINTPSYTLYILNVLYPQNPVWIMTTYDSLQKAFAWIVDSLPGEYRLRIASYFTDGSSLSNDSNAFTIAPITLPEASPSPSIEPEPSASASASPSASASTSPSQGNLGSGNGGNGGGGSSSGGSGGGSVSAPSCSNEAPKTAPKIVAAVTTGKNEITLTWNKAENPVTHYVIAYGLVKGQPLYGNPNIGNVTSFSVKGLAGGLTYYFKVRAGNDCMPGAYSEEIAVKVGGKFTSSQASLINSPAQGFKAGVLGKSTVVKASSKPALAKPVVFAPSAAPQPQPNGGLINKVFNFFSGFFKP